VSRPNDSVPTQAIRNGDFSGLAATIYDPLTGNPDGSGRTSVPGQPPPGRTHPPDQPPDSRESPAAEPGGHLAGHAQQLLQRRHGETESQALRPEDQLEPRPELAVWGKYSRMDGYWNSKFALGEVGGPGLSRAGSPGTNIMDVNIVTVGQTWTAVADPGAGQHAGVDQVRAIARGARLRQQHRHRGLGHSQHQRSGGHGIRRGTGAGEEGLPRDGRGACYSGMPAINHGFTAWGNTFGYLPLFRQGARLYLHCQCEQDSGRPRAALGIRHGALPHGPLAAGSGLGTAGQPDLQRQRHRHPGLHGQLLEPIRDVPARPGHLHGQDGAVFRNDQPGVAIRLVCAGPLATYSQSHAESGLRYEYYP
jgi:hypothetical protein